MMGNSDHVFALDCLFLGAVFSAQFAQFGSLVFTRPVFVIRAVKVLLSGLANYNGGKADWRGDGSNEFFHGLPLSVHKGA